MFGSIVKKLKKNVGQWIKGINAPVRNLLEKQIIMQAQIFAGSNRHNHQLNDLSDVEFSAFSQWGEDGIIDWLVSQLPSIPQTFIEFGVENYQESNTRLLLLLHNWNGLVMDGSETNIKDIHNQSIYWRYALTAKQAFIDKDNVNSLIREAGFSVDIGILSIDIDGNDYWVWQAIDTINPTIVVCEYNAVFGDLHALTIPYRRDFNRTKAHYSNLYFGASLLALIDLGKQKGYSMVGTNSAGNNAFFVRNDLVERIKEKLSGFWAFHSRIRESRDRYGTLTFLDGISRSIEIADRPVVNIQSGEHCSLVNCGVLYSEAWKNSFRIRV